MIELSNERMEELLHRETPKNEDLKTILRSIYNRYRHLYEKYFADVDTLDDDEIAEMKKYHEETKSLIRYYYMDIPLDVCAAIDEFEKKYTDPLLGDKWREYLRGCYEEFRKRNKGESRSEGELKSAFAKQALELFYDAMDYVFREGFGTGSQTLNKTVSRITELLLGKKE